MGFPRFLKRKRTRTFSESAPTPISQFFAEWYSTNGAVSRETALTVPPILRGVNILCSVATLPLVCYDRENKIVDNPLLDQIDPDVPNVVTLSDTIRDLIFDGISWWQILGFGWDGYPVSARRVAPTSVQVQPVTDRSLAPLPSGIDPRGARVYIDGREVSWGEVIRFDSPNPSVTKAAARAIRRAVLLDKLATMYADDPRPLDYFAPDPDKFDPEEHTMEEVADIINKWKAARKSRSTGYVPSWLKWNVVDQPSAADAQVVDLMKQATLDLANALGLDAADLNTPINDRTYNNAVDRRRDRINDVLNPYIQAVTQRLSMRDITKRGQRVRFDLDDYMKANPTERVAYYKAMVDMGAMDADEVRAKEGLAGPAPRKPEPRPAIQAQVVEPPAVESGQSRPRAIEAANASHPLVARFDAESIPSRFVQLQLQSFSVDRESRTITGIAVPYGAVGNGVRFEKGALKFSDVSRIKLNMDHETGYDEDGRPTGRPPQYVGVATDIKDSNNGLLIKFYVSRTPEGDRALTLAEDGVYDGLSVEIDRMQAVAIPDPRRRSGQLVQSAPLLGVALTANPAFADARLTAVKFTKEDTVPDNEPTTTEPQAQPAAPTPAQPQPVALTNQTGGATVPVQFSADQAAQFQQFMAWQAAQGAHGQAPVEPRQIVNPTRLPIPGQAAPQARVTREALPYRFDRAGRFVAGEYEFSTDLIAAHKMRDVKGMSEPGKRAFAAIRAIFAADPTISTDVDELNPAIQRPDLYVGQLDMPTPIWDAINKGGLPNGLQPFVFPKRASSTIAVAAHVEGTEPEGKGVMTTSQTVTPSALSAKASVTREVYDMGGNPAVSNLIKDEFRQSWREGLETAAATFLNTLTAAPDITLTDATDKGFKAKWEAAVIGFNFIRAYNLDYFFANEELFTRFVSLKKLVGSTFDTSGAAVADIYGSEPEYPIISPVNANGQTTSRFTLVNAGGYIVRPSGALPNGSGAAANSWIFDSRYVHGWAQGPQEFEFPGTDASGNYAPLAMIDLAVFGYRAFACRDINAVRQVIYSTTP